MSDIVRFALILFLVNLIAASLLVGVYNLTHARIEELKTLSEKEAIREVMPSSIGEFLEPVEAEGKMGYIRVYKDKEKSILSGYIFTTRQYGYSSVIETMVGMAPDGRIIGIKILNQNETPGLGSRIVETFSGKTIFDAIKDIFSKEKKKTTFITPWFCEQFKGKRVEALVVVKTKTKDKIEAITGATISSKAVTDSIRKEAERILDVERKR